MSPSAAVTGDGAADDLVGLLRRIGRGGPCHTYVLCTEDNTVDPRLQRVFVEEMDAVAAKPTHVVELACSHSPFLSRPGELAAIIDRASSRA